MRTAFVSCVKTKFDHIAEAKDLTFFNARHECKRTCLQGRSVAGLFLWRNAQPFSWQDSN
jgi:hypothetical protein